MLPHLQLSLLLLPFLILARLFGPFLPCTEHEKHLIHGRNKILLRLKLPDHFRPGELLQSRLIPYTRIKPVPFLYKAHDFAGPFGSMEPSLNVRLEQNR
ncbi:hypothetical protein D3C81_1483080 [compost metagenome]